MIDLHALQEETRRIRPLPSSVARLMMVLNAGEPDHRQVSEIISSDPALTLLVLRVANSTVYGGRRDVSTVSEAISRLGTATITSLVIGSGTHDLMSAPIPAYDLQRGELWRQATTACVAAEALVRIAGGLVPVEAATAALLHDIGKLVLGKHLSPSVRSVLAEAAQQSERSRAEREVLGVHQAEIGALITDLWRLPRSIVHAIQYQAAPRDYLNTLDSDERTLRLCQAVHAAIFLTERLDDVSSGPLPQAGEIFAHASAVTRDAFDALKLSEATSIELLRNLGPARDARMGSYG